MCAIALAEAARTGEGWYWSWFGVEVVWRIAAGVGIGVLLGYALGWLVFRLLNRAKMSKTGDGFVALGITVIVYGVAEAAHGYGFVSVFVAALALRASERNHEYHETLHDFAEQLERLLMMVVLVMFGVALTRGGILAALTWQSVVYTMLAIFLVRPLAAWLSLEGANCPPVERMAISFFGIRGIGTIYYLAFAFQKETFDQTDVVWSTISLIILTSVVLHGVTVTPVMKFIDRRRENGVTDVEISRLKGGAT